jgi:hypothetical protein
VDDSEDAAFDEKEVSEHEVSDESPDAECRPASPAPYDPDKDLDCKHSNGSSGGLCPRDDLSEQKRIERAKAREAVAGSTAWDVISAIGRTGESIVAAVDDDESARAELRAMTRIGRMLSDSSASARRQTIPDDVDEADADASVDWAGKPRDLPHERLDPDAADLAAPAAISTAPPPPRRSTRTKAAKSVFSALGIVNTDDLLLSDDEAAPVASAARLRKRPRHS